MGSMSHWPIEKGENNVNDTLSIVYEVVFCVCVFGSHDLLGLKNVLGRFGTTRVFGVLFTVNWNQGDNFKFHCVSVV